MKCLIVEDEALAAYRLARMIEELQPQIECFIARNGEEGLQKFEMLNPEMVFLDIRMPGLDGLEVASRLQAKNIPPAIIFCTAYETHALEAIHRQASAYLLKPVNKAHLSEALKKCFRTNRIHIASFKKKESPEYICSKTHRGIERIELETVRCFIAEEKYVLACGENQELLISDSLRDLESKFSDRLLRIHRKALIATKFLEGLYRSRQGWNVFLKGTDNQPPVSRRHLKQVRHALRR